MKATSDGGGGQAPDFRLLCLPEGFDPRDFGFWDADDRMGFLTLVSRLATAPRASDRDGWTPVRRAEARAILPNWEAKREHAERRGMLECDHRSAKGEKAFWYRLGLALRDRPIRLARTEEPRMLELWDLLRGRKRPAGSKEPPVVEGPIERHLEPLVAGLHPRPRRGREVHGDRPAGAEAQVRGDGPGTDPGGRPCRA